MSVTTIKGSRIAKRHDVVAREDADGGGWALQERSISGAPAMGVRVGSVRCSADGAVLRTEKWMLMVETVKPAVRGCAERGRRSR